MKLNKIIISRTDSIGDVVLTLPMAGILKANFPELKIYFLGKAYTRSIAESSEYIHEFVDWGEIQNLDISRQIQRLSEIGADAIIHVFPVREIAFLAKKAKIPLRIGTTGRLYHYFTCNKIIPFSRKRSNLHEAQLNLKLLSPFIKNTTVALEKIHSYYGFNKVSQLSSSQKEFIIQDKFNLILHPKSKGSAREWGLDNFAKLIESLPKDKFNIFITGTREEGKLMEKEILQKFSTIVDLTGKLSLKELISFINEADGLVAASTGPLHIAAALGKHALGIYPPIRPMDPGRWAPLGINAVYFVEEKTCSECRNKEYCECMENVSPELVKNKLISLTDG